MAAFQVSLSSSNPQMEILSLRILTNPHSAFGARPLVGVLPKGSGILSETSWSSRSTYYSSNLSKGLDGNDVSRRSRHIGDVLDPLGCDSALQKAAQHSVHPPLGKASGAGGWDSPRFQAVSLAQASSVKAAASRPAHQPPSGMLRDGYPLKGTMSTPLGVTSKI